jgi:hypothetical protein
MIEKATILEEARRLNSGNFRTKRHHKALREFAEDALHIKITDAVLNQLFAEVNPAKNGAKPHPVHSKYGKRREMFPCNRPLVSQAA